MYIYSYALHFNLNHFIDSLLLLGQLYTDDDSITG